MKTPERLSPNAPESAGPTLTVRGTKISLPLSLVIIGTGALLLLPTLVSPLLGGLNIYWYLSRSSALVAYFLLWASMVFGVSITNKLARLWPGAPTAFELHQHTSLLGLGFALVHVLTLLGDTYIGYNLFQLLVPFASAAYEPLWVGIGQIAFYLLIPVTLSFYARKRLGTRGWRTLHGLSYALFVLALLHGLFSGTDSSSWWATGIYWFSGISLTGLTRPGRADRKAPVAAVARRAGMQVVDRQPSRAAGS